MILLSFLHINSSERKKPFFESHPRLSGIRIASQQFPAVLRFPGSRKRLLVFSVCFRDQGDSVSSSMVPNANSVLIREVWSHNLEMEFELIRNIVDNYPFIAMDTEYPGIVVRSLGNFSSVAERNYHTLKCNVDLLKLIQVGLTFADGEGNLPTCGTERRCIWQFNFREFSLADDVYAADSIDLLTRSGIDFAKNKEMGVDCRRFSELLISSGVVLNDAVQWITFHSGYDFAYLVKSMTCKSLPDTLVEFLALNKAYFPVFYDLKHLTRFCDNLHGGLNRIAEVLEVERFGISHQAGSDSLLTCWTFLKLMNMYPGGSMFKDVGVLYGLHLQN